MTGKPDTVRQALREPELSPLRGALDVELEEEAVPEIWHRIDARLSVAQSARPRRASFVVLSAAALVLLLIGGFWLRRPASGTALALEGRAVPNALSAAERPRTFAFADGSQLELATFTDLHLLANDGHTFMTALARGRTTFDVRPGGPRRWIVEAGFATVEVLGTRFIVERDGASVRVEVERGSVLVRSGLLSGGSVRLTAGQKLVVTAPSAAGSAPATIAPAAPPLAASTPVAPSAAAAGATPPLVPSAKGGASADAVDRALEAADSARRRHEPSEAARALEAALAAAGPSDKRRGLAALSLARLIVASEPDRAARVLRDSFGAVPKGLQEDALARRVEAESRAGHFAEASRLGAEYERRFPAGQRLNEVRRWSAP